MNKKHTFKVGKHISMLCLLFVCATVLSCRDEYTFDDPGNVPTWLGESIYEELQSAHNLGADEGRTFNYFLKVIDDVEKGKYKEVLLKTGSKTLFVADDSAFMKGIKDEWGFDSYDQLNPGHKKIILFGAMLDNAYLLEMMSSTAATGNQTEPNENLCLRQVTSSNVTDTIPLFVTEDLPPFNRFWDHMRSKAANGGIRMAADATDVMMVHFLSGYVTAKGFTNRDMKYLLNREDATTEDAYIFDKKVIKRDVTCKNGYIHLLDGLLIPPSNMAEEIRHDERITIFSRLLERFAVPVYNEELTSKYNELYHLGDDANSEVVYEKRYFNSGSTRSLFDFKNPDMDSTYHNEGLLPYSPGWNAYQPGLSPENNMGAIFAPIDDSLKHYFKEGEGKSLLQRYGKNAKALGSANLSDEQLLEDLDSIPANIVQKFMDIMLRPSFNETVPSKFATVKDDAQDPMGVSPEHLDPALPCIIANNGVVYVTQKVYSPADYRAVSAPILLQENLRILERAVDWRQFYAYYKSMQSEFSVIVCPDDALIYYDPCTSQTTTPNEGTITTNHYAYQMTWDPKSTQTWKVNGKDVKKDGKITFFQRTYSPNDPYKLSSDSVKTDAITENAIDQILDYCTVVGDFTDGNQYYMTKGYGTVKVKNENGAITEIWGGRELEDNLAGRRSGGLRVGEVFQQANGNTYRLDEGLVHPATRSIYNILKSTPEFSEFFKLCESHADVIDELRHLDEKNKLSTGVKDSLPRYYIFENQGGLDMNVRFFDTYHYTVYVPTNNAIKEAYEAGLPNWDELEEMAANIKANDNTVEELLDSIDNLETELLEKEESDTEAIASLNAQIAALNAKIDQLDSESETIAAEMKVKTTLLVDFVKYHFQDNSVYVDNKPHTITEGATVKEIVDYETAAVDPVSKRFLKLSVQTEKGDSRDDYNENTNTLRIEGDLYDEDNAPLNVCHVINLPDNENKLYNIMARDIQTEGTTTPKLKTSAYAVVHQIDNYLVNENIYMVDENGNGKFKINR